MTQSEDERQDGRVVGTVPQVDLRDVAVVMRSLSGETSLDQRTCTESLRVRGCLVALATKPADRGMGAATAA